MDNLRELLHATDCRGAVRSADGAVRIFRNRGVADLITLLAEEPQLLHGATVADKIVGRGAAYLFIKGGVKAVFAEVITPHALTLLQQAGIAADYGLITPYILNRTGNDLCPVEKLTAHATNAEEAYHLIKHFIEGKQQKA